MAAFFISIRGKSTIGFLSLGWEGNTLFPWGKNLSSIQEPWNLLGQPLTGCQWELLERIY